MERFKQEVPLFPSSTGKKDTKHEKKLSYGYQHEFDHYYHNPTSTVIRPERNQRAHIGEQLERLISRPVPSIFAETKKIDVGLYKQAVSRSKSKKEGNKDKLLQQISQKLNTVISPKSKACLKKGELDPTVKMTFQRQPSLKIVQLQNTRNITVQQVKSLQTITPFQDFNPRVQNQQQQIISKQQKVETRVQVINNYIPLYDGFIVFPSKKQDKQEIELEKTESEQEEIVQNNSFQKEQIHQNKEEEQILQTPQTQNIPQNPNIPQTPQVTQQQQMHPHKQQLIFEPQIKAQNTHDQQPQIQEQQLFNTIKQIQSPVLEEPNKTIQKSQVTQTISNKSQLSQTEQLAEQHLEQIVIKDDSSLNDDLTNVQQDTKRQQSIEPQSVINDQSQQNHHCIADSLEQLPQQLQKQQLSEEQQIQLSRQQEYQALERFIKQNEEKMNKNRQVVNMRRQIQHDIEKFWYEEERGEESKKEEEEEEEQFEEIKEQNKQQETKESQVNTQQQQIEEEIKEEIKQEQTIQNTLLEKNDSELNINQFVKGKKLGKGMFGEVFIVRHLITGFLCAMKVLNKQFIRAQKMTQQLLQELKIHTFLNHPNIVQIYGYFADEQNIYVLQELCTSGQLYDLVVKRRRISQKRAAYYMKQLAQGLRYLQSVNIAHRDIKPENILIQQGVVKICDFGWAMYSLQNTFTEQCGTPLYYSPEIVRKQTYTDQVDVWGLGLITYQLIIGSIPWNIWTQDQISKIATDDLTFPSYVSISPKAQDFIRKAMTKSSSQRITLLQSFTHDFLINVNPMQYQDQSCQSYGQATPY